MIAMARDPTTPKPPRKEGRKGNRGVALIVALLVVTILTVTTLEFHFESQVDMQVALGKRDGFKAYLIASSGIRVAEKLLFEQFLAGKDPVTFDDVPSIEEINRLLAEACAQAAEASGNRVPEGLEDLPINLSAGGIDTGCGAPATLPVVELYKFAEVGEGDSLDISFEDEDSKINLNALVDPNGRVVPSLRNLLEAFLLTTLIDPETGAPEIAEVELGGFRKQEFTPTHLANAIIDWMDADDVPLDGGGFEENFYDYPYEIKNNPFETLNELRFVKGVAEYALLDRLGCYFTVDSNTVQINVNRTPLPVLRAMILAAFADGETNPFDYLDVANEMMEAIDERRRQTPLVQLVAKYLQCPFEPPEAACGSGPFQTPKGSARQRS
ncbi:MAG: hypothetical protein D6812_13810, partial [Deltaproteobacteria bacterium]